MSLTDNVPLIDGFINYDWSETPRQFRMVVDKKRLVKLVRNAESIRHHSLGLDTDITPQKTALVSDIRSNTTLDDCKIAVTFNGLDLFIIGVVSGNGVDGTEEWLEAFEAGE